jgi:hypothetical protein
MLANPTCPHLIVVIIKGSCHAFVVRIWVKISLQQLVQNVGKATRLGQCSCSVLVSISSPLVALGLDTSLLLDAREPARRSRAQAKPLRGRNHTQTQGMQ